MLEAHSTEPGLKTIRRTVILAIGLCLFFSACSPVKESPSEGLGTIELIDLLADPDELTRTHAHEELQRYLVTDTDSPAFTDRLTLFHKHAPHACKAGNIAQTLHILSLFGTLEDISSVLLKQCLKSPHAKVRATALELTHFSDNRIDETLLAFKPDPTTISSYRLALQKLGGEGAMVRLAELEAED